MGTVLTGSTGNVTVSLSSVIFNADPRSSLGRRFFRMEHKV
jgi:hypothetical protein